jgi:hypothetical protein
MTGVPLGKVRLNEDFGRVVGDPKITPILPFWSYFPLGGHQSLQRGVLRVRHLHLMLACSLQYRVQPIDQAGTGTFSFALGCTVWDLFACMAGSWVAQKLMKLRTAAPLLAGAITGSALASIPFWIYRGYGHFLFEGTWADIGSFFAEGHGIAFPFVIAPALGVLTVIHSAFWLRDGKERSISIAA